MSDRPDKKLVASFVMDDGKGKKVHFGSKTSTTFVEGADKETRENYITRHQVNEDWSKADAPGSLSRYILWGDSSNVNKNISAFKKMYGV